MKITSLEAQNLINSLRIGVTPSAYIGAFLTGRSAEKMMFNHTLAATASGQSHVKWLTGDFGTGKSLMLECIKQSAVNSDFVVASLSLGDGFRLNKIDDFYYSVMHHLYIKASLHEKTSFNEIFDVWIENLQHSPIPNHKRFEINTVCQELSKFNMSYARGFLSFMRARIQHNPEMLNVTTAWLTGEKNIPYELKQKYNLVGSVDKATSLDFFKAFIKLITLLDYKGLVIIVDEMDQLIYERSDLRMKAYQNIKNLLDLTGSSDISNTFIVFSGAPELFTNEEQGILSLTPLAQRLHFTSYDDIDYDQLNQTIVPLSPLTPEEYTLLCERVINCYYIAYKKEITETPEAISAKLLADLEPDTLVTRTFVTSLIAYLDSL